MSELDDPKLLAQCGRIKAMIQQVAQNPKFQDDYYAKNYHHWRVGPPAPLEEIEQFEQQAGVELPIEYVYYLNQVGRSGACPGTRFDDFSKLVPNKELTQISDQLREELTEAAWQECFGDLDWEQDREVGTISLCAMDLTYIAYLIVTGPQRGRVVYMDYDNDMAPMWPKGSPDFLTWCENFYSELLAGYDISPTWKFMWHELGDESALIRAFHQAEDLNYKKDVLLSFFKFPNLAQEARTFLSSIREQEYQETIAKVFHYFSIPIKTDER